MVERPKSREETPKKGMRSKAHVQVTLQHNIAQALARHGCILPRSALAIGAARFAQHRRGALSSERRLT